MSVHTQMAYEFGDIAVDTRAERVTKSGVPVSIEPKAFRLLAHLLAHRDQLVEKGELLRVVWGDVFVGENALTRAIAQVRKALGDDARESRYIETVQRRGYRFIGAVTEGTSRAEPLAGAPVAVPPDDQAPMQARRRRVAMAAALIVLAGAGAVGWGWYASSTTAGGPGGPITSVAVLPLRDLSGDGSQGYVADGLTEAFITELARNKGLRIIARDSSMQGRGEEAAATVVSVLHVDALVRGSVVRSGNRVRVTAQLVRTSTGETLWAESYEHDLGDLIGLQRRIAESVAREVNVSVLPARPVTARNVDAWARELYLRGRELYYRGINAEYPESGAALGLAIEQDPDRLFASSREADRRAIALDETCAEAHGALGYATAAYFRDSALAEREFRRAFELAPGTSTATDSP